MGLYGFAWDSLGIKNPAKPRGLRGLGAGLSLYETGLNFIGCNTYRIQLDEYSYGYE